MGDKRHNGWTNFATYHCAFALGDYESPLNKAVQRCNGPDDLLNLVSDHVYANITGGAANLTFDIVSNWVVQVNFEEIWENRFDANAGYDDLPCRLAFIDRSS